MSQDRDSLGDTKEAPIAIVVALVVSGDFLVDHAGFSGI